MKKLTLILFAAFLQSPAHALISPYAMMANELAASIGADPCINVSLVDRPDGAPQVVVKACNQVKAEALAALLTPADELVIENQDGTPAKAAPMATLDDLVAVTEAAFQDNPYYSNSYKYDMLGGDPSEVLIEFKPQIIQVFIDNIANPYGTESTVAADLFAKYLKKAFFSEYDDLWTFTGPKG
jgi:hypothetical protein